MIYAPLNFDEAWKRRRSFKLGDTEIFIASLEDLKLLKEDAIKNRSLTKDQNDLKVIQQLMRKEHEPD